MATTIVVGGFYGDEGKGKIVGYLAEHDKMQHVVRAGGGPQAGHTVTRGLKVTQIPSGFVNTTSKLYIARGTVINPATVISEIVKYDCKNRIRIDYGCTVIESDHIEREKDLVERIGSVGTGTGPARMDRLNRSAKLAKDIPALAPYLGDVADEINNAVTKKQRILIEGVQGFGLSLLDHEYYPNVTSQDTTASQFCADVGLGPKAIDEIVCVFKSYMSRVGKGELETAWTEEEQQKYGIKEFGSVSGRPRRLGHFDDAMARKAIQRNTATQGALTCLDRLFPGNTGADMSSKLTPDAQEFLQQRDFAINGNWHYRGIQLISTGPDLEQMIDNRSYIP
ncbi:adenylosuccinate synthetase [Candidatus Woesearchaeota archaeon]|nr:adenylosuccinate synthetase [Candidatus Woesearchaeota archaeon]